MGWSDEAFRTRVKARARELNKSIRSVLDAAGLSHETVDKVPTSSRRIDTLEKLAGPLEWTLADIMGFSAGHIDPTLLIAAFYTARRALRRVPNYHEAALIELAARLYDVLLDRQREGLPLDAPALDAIAAGVAAAWARASR